MKHVPHKYVPGDVVLLPKGLDWTPPLPGYSAVRRKSVTCGVVASVRFHYMLPYFIYVVRWDSGRASSRKSHSTVLVPEVKIQSLVHPTLHGIRHEIRDPTRMPHVGSDVVYTGVGGVRETARVLCMDTMFGVHGKSIHCVTLCYRNGKEYGVPLNDMELSPPHTIANRTSWKLVLPGRYRKIVDIASGLGDQKCECRFIDCFPGTQSASGPRPRGSLADLSGTLRRSSREWSWLSGFSIGRPSMSTG